MREACNTAFCALSARAILDRVAAARGLMAGASKARDIEAVHDMRVASRRLRAALALFELCLPFRARLWRKDIRRITRALGRARDLDVQIQTVQSALKKHSSWYAGLGCILDGLENRRRRAQRKVAKALARTRRSGVLDHIEASLAPIAKAVPGEGAAWKKAYRQAGKVILRLLGDLTSYEADLKRPGAAGRHHQMRIAAKHLRYSLEVFEPMYGRALAPAIGAAKTMQSLLGGMHDCDVWELSLPKSAAGGSIGRVIAGMPATKAQAISAFARDRRNRRLRLYKQARQCWRKCKKDKVWLKLRQTLAVAAATAPVAFAKARRAASLHAMARGPRSIAAASAAARPAARSR